MRSLLASLPLLLALPVTGCSTEAPADLDDCPEGSTVTWATVEPVFTAHCANCHSSTLTTSAERQSAPSGWDYDTAASSMRDPDESWRRIYIDNMPPTGPLEESDKLLIWEWYSCDGPE